MPQKIFNLKRIYTENKIIISTLGRKNYMAYNKTKTDPALGQKVHEHLISVGVETPVIDNGLSRNEKIDKIQSHFKEIVTTLGIDLKDDSLTDTPKRIAKMYVNEIFWG